MNKKLLITIGILGLIVVAIVFFWESKKPEKPWECKTDEDCKNVRCVGAYCENGECKCPPSKSDLSRIKVAVVYQHIMDNIPPERSLNDVSKIFNETKTDFVIRASFKWYAMPERFYEEFRDAVKKIRAENPEIIICGSFGAQFIDKRGEYDPIKKKILSESEVEEMALNLSKHSEWNLDEEKIEEFWNINNQASEYGRGYLPGITNKKFQELVINIAKRQIDEGADAIWIDGLYKQTRILAQVTRNLNHIAVKESFEGSSEIVDEIHEYAKKKEREVYVGTWVDVAFFPFQPPKFDFLTFSPNKEEVLSKEFNEKKWDSVKSKVEENFGEIPILVYLDYSMSDDSPLAIFSQKLSPDEQREFLIEVDEFVHKKGMIFAYPVHGFFMGQNATILSFGKFPIYDSLAPEFETYETIKELAQKKAGVGKRDDVVVIAGIPFAESTYREIPKPSWKEVEEALPALKEAGVDTIYIWAPYEHRFPEPGETITAYTEDGEIELGGLAPCVHIKNYLKPDPERGSEEEFLHMIDKAHSLGIKVIAQLQVTLSTPGDFVYDEHQDWILKSMYGKPAVFWPWDSISYGFIVNKANPEFIDYVTAVVIPHWIKKWGVDGIYLDSPGMAYCDSYVKDLCEKVGCVKGYECLTPVDGYHSPEPLVRAMKVKMEELEEETGRELTFSAEEGTFKTWQDMPEDIIVKACKGKIVYQTDSRVDRSLGNYFDFVLGYSFRGLLKDVSEGGDASYSEKYVEFIKMLDELDGGYTKTARFVDMWIKAHNYAGLLKPDVAGNYITLSVTAPGNVVWIGTYQLPPQDYVGEELLGWDSDVLREWYTKTIKIKKEHMALQTDNIENALISPKVKGLIAYNRWDGGESVTVVVNTNNKPVDCTVKTRFEGEITVYDLISGDMFEGDPKNLKIKMPAYGSRLLILESDR